MELAPEVHTNSQQTDRVQMSCFVAVKRNKRTENLCHQALSREPLHPEALWVLQSKQWMHVLWLLGALCP